MCGHRLPKTDGNDDNDDDNVGDDDGDGDGDAFDDENEDRYFFFGFVFVWCSEHCKKVSWHHGTNLVTYEPEQIRTRDVPIATKTRLSQPMT